MALIKQNIALFTLYKKEIRKVSYRVLTKVPRYGILIMSHQPQGGGHGTLPNRNPALVRGTRSKRPRKGLDPWPPPQIGEVMNGQNKEAF